MGYDSDKISSREEPNPFVINDNVVPISRNSDDFKSSDFDNLPLCPSFKEPIHDISTLSPQAVEFHRRFGDLISDFIACHDQSDKNFLSNVRMIFQLTMDGYSDILKAVLVQNFSEYYGHTMYNADPDDILTYHSLDAKANIDAASISNPNQIIN